MNAGQNLSTSGQMNAQGPNAQVSGVNAGQQFQQGRNFSQNEGTRLQSKSRNQYGMTPGKYSSPNRDRDRFAYGRDRDRFAYGRDRDRDRFAYAGRDRDRFAYSGSYTDRDRFVDGGWNGGWNNGWGGPAFDVSVGYGGWGWPGYYDSGYGYGSPGLYSYAPGYVGVGFGAGGCSCGAPGRWR
jgi:hypothetical protein